MSGQCLSVTCADTSRGQCWSSQVLSMPGVKLSTTCSQANLRCASACSTEAFQKSLQFAFFPSRT